MEIYKIKSFILIVFLFLLETNLSYSQPNEEWIRTFNSGSNNQDYVSDMKMDKSGNIYMCGYVRYDSQNSDVLLLKYNSNGDFQWSRTYNGRSTFSNDEAMKMIIDDSGFVYLMGSVQFNTILDFLVMKYTPGGDTIWVRRFDGGNGNTDRARDITLDQNNNVYVTGLLNRNGDSDIGTLKYDKNGNLKWVRINSYGSPNNILIDSGKVFINCGLYADTSNRYNITILKYDTTGNSSDTISYRVSVNMGDKLMIFDSDKNFIITGEYDAGLPTQINILTSKISYAGVGKWKSIFDDNHNNNAEYLYDLKKDNNDNIYILARSRDQNLRSEFAVIKYNNFTGDSIWTRKYNSVPYANDEPSEMSIDKNGNVYVTGSSDFNLINFRFVTIKYNPNGVLQWHKEYTPSVFVNSEGLRILNDTIGNLYVSGITNSSQNGDDIVLIKYSHLTEIEQINSNVPTKYELHQNYPNPFNSQTEINFDLMKSGNYKLEVYDVIGKRVDVLFDEFKNSGSYKINYNATMLSSGVYLYHLISNEINIVRKFVLIK